MMISISIQITFIDDYNHIRIELDDVQQRLIMLVESLSNNHLDEIQQLRVNIVNVCIVNICNSTILQANNRIMDLENELTMASVCNTAIDEQCTINNDLRADVKKVILVVVFIQRYMFLV